MRVAVIVVFVSVLTTPSEASKSCMSKTEARQAFHSSHIYWHGKDHCWDATPIRRHGVRHRVHHHEPEVRAATSRPSPDLRRAAIAMMVTEPYPLPELQDTTWRDRWTDITQVVPRPTIAIIVERKPEPMVTPRGVVAVILTIILTVAIVEVLFGHMINEKMRQGKQRQRHRGFAS